MARMRRRLLVGLVVAGGLFCLADVALLTVRLLWPQARIELGTAALARLETAGIGERVSSVEVRDAAGEPVAVSLKAGRIEPTATLPGGSTLHVKVTVSRSKWIGWLVGRTEQAEAVVHTPAAHLSSTFVYPPAGEPVRVRFSRPVRIVSVSTGDRKQRLLTLPTPRRVVSIGILASGENLAGTAFVAGAPRKWEQLPDPVRVNWFPAGPKPHVLVRPAPRTTLVPSGPIVLTFSRPVDEILGTARPALVPKTRGAWHQPNDHTLVFQPSGLGFPLGRRVHLELPRPVEVIAGADPSPYRTLTWQVPRGSLLRLKELLAELGYLPVRFAPSGPPVRTTASAQARAAIAPPRGTFEWRYEKTPQALKALWASGADRQTLIRGAIMAFQDAHGLKPDGFPSMAVFRGLLRDTLAGRMAPHGYSYVFVDEALPQTLTLWHAGKVVLRALVNTGISSRPTDVGTFPVYLRFTATTMAGTNPDGSHYNDPGVPWVNYFSGGDAIHGFVRPGYGYPQSLGCVEAPIDTAARIFPYVHVGTLVTVD
jgi:hypothetical protein